MTVKDGGHVWIKGKVTGPWMDKLRADLDMVLSRMGKS